MAWGSNRDINIFTVYLNVGVLRGVSGGGFEGRRSLLNNSVRGSNLAGKEVGGMAMVLGDQV